LANNLDEGWESSHEQQTNDCFGTWFLGRRCALEQSNHAHGQEGLRIDFRRGENPLTSVADDAERTRKMIAQQKGPVLLVGHSYGGAVITEAGNQPNVVGLVSIAAFALDAGESCGGMTAANPPAAADLRVLLGMVRARLQLSSESFL
jgi:pimeloyl-ACP methyl ester carboxylesterase